MANKVSGSIAVFPLHLGGTNGSKIEFNAIFVPPYNAARRGLRLVASPRQADVVVLMGQLTARLVDPALELLASLPDYIKLVQLGSETTSAAPFAKAYAAFGPLQNESEVAQFAGALPGLALPPGKTIAAYVAGSPPDPQAIIEAILQVAG